MSWGSAAENKHFSTDVRPGLEWRVSGCSEWIAGLDVGPGAAPEEVVVAVGADLELVLDLVWRSRKVTLD